LTNTNLIIDLLSFIQLFAVLCQKLETVAASHINNVKITYSTIK